MEEPSSYSLRSPLPISSTASRVTLSSLASPLFVHSTAGSIPIPPPDVAATLAQSHERMQHGSSPQSTSGAWKRVDEAVQVSATLASQNQALECKLRDLSDQVALLQTLTTEHGDAAALTASVDALRGKLAAQARAEAAQQSAALVEARIAMSKMQDRSSVLESELARLAEELATARALGEAHKRALQAVDAELGAHRTAAATLRDELEACKRELEAAKQAQPPEVAPSSPPFKPRIALPRVLPRASDLVQVELDLSASAARESELVRANRELMQEVQRLNDATLVNELVSELELVRLDRRRERAGWNGRLAAAKAVDWKSRAELARMQRRVEKYRAHAKITKFVAAKAVAELVIANNSKKTGNR